MFKNTLRKEDKTLPTRTCQHSMLQKFFAYLFSNLLVKFTIYLTQFVAEKGLKKSPYAMPYSLILLLSFLPPPLHVNCSPFLMNFLTSRTNKIRPSVKTTLENLRISFELQRTKRWPFVRLCAFLCRVKVAKTLHANVLNLFQE